MIYVILINFSRRLKVCWFCRIRNLKHEFICVWMPKDKDCCECSIYLMPFSPQSLSCIQMQSHTCLLFCIRTRHSLFDLKPVLTLYANIQADINIRVICQSEVHLWILNSFWELEHAQTGSINVMRLVEGSVSTKVLRDGQREVLHEYMDIFLPN